MFALAVALLAGSVMQRLMPVTAAPAVPPKYQAVYNELDAKLDQLNDQVWAVIKRKSPDDSMKAAIRAFSLFGGYGLAAPVTPHGLSI
jgi:hypothetical protein